MSNDSRDEKELHADPQQEHTEEEKQTYVPRPRWQVIMAWILFAIVVIGILNVCYWEIFQH